MIAPQASQFTFALMRGLALSLSLLIAGAARAGDEPAVKFRMRLEPSRVTVPLNTINLRPNTPTAMGVYLQNPGDRTWSDVKVLLVYITDDRTHVLAQTVVTLPANKETRVELVKKKETADKLELAGPPYRLQLWHSAGPKQLKDTDGFAKIDLDLRVRSPRDFVEVKKAEYDKNTRQLRFLVKLKDALVGPTICPVQLVLGPEIKKTEQGTFKQVLSKPDQVVELFAENVELVGGADAFEAPIYLNVDGYERAFTYTLKDTGELVELLLNNRVGVRLDAPRFAAPSEKLPAVLELDGPVDAPYTVEFGLDRAGKKEQFQTRRFTGIRKQHVHLGTGPTGDLIWRAEVAQWKVDLDVSEIFGPVWLRVRVFDKDKEVDLVRSQGAGPMQVIVQADVEAPKSLFAKMMIDPTGPRDIEFVELPKQWVVGKPLPVLVKIRHQAIDKVLLLRGKAPADGKLNPDAILGEKGDFLRKQGEWLLTIPPQVKAEPLEISVYVTTLTGKHGAKSATIVFTEAGGLNTLATIKGKVVHGALAQPKLKVLLFDAKGKPKGSTETNKKGEFVFEKVPPGDYVIYSMMTFPSLVARENLTVPPGKELIDNVKVRLLAK